MLEELDAHCRIVLRRLREGKVIPFLGAGANLCGRPDGADWRAAPYLPSGKELATYLAESYAYPSDETHDLLRVSQYVQAVTGGTVLYDELRDLFAGDYTPTSLHTLLAGLPAALRAARDEGTASPHLLIVTTNYDDMLERALTEAGEEFDLVSYVAKGPDRGKFLHRPTGKEARLIDEPNKYTELSLARGAVVLKIHGAIDRDDPERDSYVITEDHYIEYLAQTDISNILPASLMAAMNESHFLFLGYSLTDWNLRVILHRIWGQQPFEDKFTSWAIQKNPSRLEERLWRRRNVEILDVDLQAYVDTLGTFLRELPAGARAR
jgi:SIR2-like domain